METVNALDDWRTMVDNSNVDLTTHANTLLELGDIPADLLSNLQLADVHETRREQFAHSTALITTNVPLNEGIPQYSTGVNDIINKLPPVTEKEYQEALHRMATIGNAYAKEIKPHVLNIIGPRVLVEARYSVIICYLDRAKVYPKKLYLAQQQAPDKKLFQKPIPYAEWIYTKRDFRKNVIVVRDGDGKFVNVAYNPKEMWDSWNNSKCFSDEMWDVMKSNTKKNIGKKRKVSEDTTPANQAAGSFQHIDDRVFRGWKNSIVVIGDPPIISCVWDALIPSYIREPNCLNNVPEHLKEREDLNDSEFGPYSMHLLQALKDRDDNLVIQRDYLLKYIMQMNITEIKQMKNMVEILVRSRQLSHEVAPSTSSNRPAQNKYNRKWRLPITQNKST